MLPPRMDRLLSYKCPGLCPDGTPECGATRVLPLRFAPAIHSFFHNQHGSVLLSHFQHEGENERGRFAG
jgi:hypothetical protein